MYIETAVFAYLPPTSSNLDADSMAPVGRLFRELCWTSAPRPSGGPEKGTK